MRQEHLAGDKLFVDHVGQTVDIVDRTTGEIRPAQIFVAVLGASNYTYAEATWSQQLSDWIGSHVRAFQFFGGVSALIVPEVGLDIQNAKGVIVGTLELAWEAARVGVAISEEDKDAAKKAGWTVWDSVEIINDTNRFCEKLNQRHPVRQR